MHILVTGGTGLIGRHFIRQYQQDHLFTVLTRSKERAARVLPKDCQLLDDLNSLTNANPFDAIINLAGEPIVDKRWSQERKRQLEMSRWDITASLTRLIKASSRPPEVFLSGSAVGFYGRQNEQLVDEFTPAHTEYSHTLCDRWERIAREAHSDHTRVCLMRTGIVLWAKGGALARMLPAFRLGLGGPMGDGGQYMPWVHLQDHINAMGFLLREDACEGAYNLCAPHPVTNAQFSQALARQLHRPCLMRVPASLLRLLMGEASDLLLTGQRAIPKRLQDEGFHFQYGELTQALADLL